MCELLLEDDGQAMLHLDAELTSEDRMAIAKLFPRGFKQERPWVHHELTTLLRDEDGEYVEHS
jgi:hypothetical protein